MQENRRLGYKIRIIMITRVVSRKGVGTKTTFSSITDYIERFEAKGHVWRSPVLSEDRSIPLQMDEVVSRGTGRVKNPAYHFVLSWNDPEVDPKVMEKALMTSLERLGVADHQWTAAEHTDSEHRHLHCLVNRINPKTFRAWTPAFDYKILRSVAKELDPSAEDRFSGKKNHISVRATDQEIWTGQQSMQTWGRTMVLPSIRKVLEEKKPSWRDLHIALLKNHGVAYEIGEGGGVFMDRSRKKRVQKITALSMDASVGLDALESILGKYQPPPFTAIPDYSHAYGTLRDSWKLPTAEMQTPEVASLYTRFIQEQEAWRIAGRYQAKMERETIQIGARQEIEVIKKEGKRAITTLCQNGGIDKRSAVAVLDPIIQSDCKRVRVDAKTSPRATQSLR